MITLISFFIVLLGAFNWLSIGLMQYDFVAGVFGTQSSFLSRMIYILVGFAAVWLIITTFLQKGKIKINDNGFKKNPKSHPHPATEFDNDFASPSNNHQDYDRNLDSPQHQKSPFED